MDSADDLIGAARACLDPDPSPRLLRLDRGKLTLCDSTGLAALLMIPRLAAASGPPSRAAGTAAGTDGHPEPRHGDRRHRGRRPGPRRVGRAEHAGQRAPRPARLGAVRWVV
ncbi:hypothetical protein [Streptomyces wuyuanensis]|uniref:hypothetical protein n=1 Tax=Streptomyces wuyuanensis TaxID=1196353 RepID=UPI003690C71E